VLVFTCENANADSATAVTYGGVSLTAVPGGLAQDSAGEPRNTKAWHLGSSIPAGVQAIVVTRTNNANVMYAGCFTATADFDTEPTGVVTAGSDGSCIETNIDDGSPGSNSLRYASCNSALNTVSASPAANTLAQGANSTFSLSIDFGTSVILMVRETTAGQGSRPVGYDAATSDDRAICLLAIREIITAAGRYNYSTLLGVR